MESTAKKVLIVEDNEHNLYLATFILEREGYQVINARDGLQALDIVSKETPDLVLMDMQLPKLDGYEATKRIKGDARLSRTCIIALTAYAMKADREKAFEVGCTGHIDKPIDPSTFANAVKEFME